MSITGLLFLIITQFAAGRGILRMFGIRQKIIVTIAISLLTGIAVFSLLPMMLEMMHIPITKKSIIISICVTTLLLNIFVLHRYDYSIFRFKGLKLKLPAIYELLFIVVYAALLIPSVWRCYFYPPMARDALSGPEVLAEYALREHKIANSVFSVNLMESTPNLLKPAFVTDLQIIYKILVQPFGQLWLTILVLSFLTWLYFLVRERMHPLLTGIIMLLFITIPEVYGYTYIILWDYSNMVYFFGGFYFLYQYIQFRQYNVFLFSCLLFGISTFVRLDSLVFIGLCGPLLFFHLYKDKTPLFKTLYSCFLLVAIPFLFYFLWVNVFVKYYLPVGINVGDELNPSSISLYFHWVHEITTKLAFGGDHIGLYGLFIYAFVLLIGIDAIFFRRFNREAIFMLFGIAIIYFGMPLLAYFTKWFNITTAKRGLFKMFPLMILYMRNSAFLLYLSQAVAAFEYPQAKEVKPAVAILQPQKKKKK